MAEFLTFDTDLTAVANAIRAKGGTSAQLIYPSGFVSAIQAIQTGITPKLVVTTTPGAAITATPAEGFKVVDDLLALQPADLIVATGEWLRGKHFGAETEVIEVTDEELKKVSFLQHPQQVLAVFRQATSGDYSINTSELSLALDGVQDPGNLGTIIRIADWFGITHIYCSQDTADVYNPKVVQATMGSIARVKVEYGDLLGLVESLPADVPVYGTLLDGDNIYQQKLENRGLIVMGNEGKGISPELAKKVNHKLLIPNFPEGRATADSLNVAIATAITCSEFRRNF